MRKTSRRREDMGYWYWLFILPALVIYLTFSILPFLSTFFYSFTNYSDINPINLSFVGLKNYFNVMKDPVMLTALTNSVVYAITLTGFQIIFGLPLAVVLNKAFRTKTILRAVFFFPAVFSSLIIGYLWNYILSPTDSGLINSIVHAMGGGTLNFFDANVALFSVIGTQVWQWTGWAMVIFLANLQSIPGDYYEAAEVDGANGLTRFFRITLPLMCPSVKIIAVTGLIGGMKVFDIIYSMTKGGPGYATETVMTTMFKKGISQGFYSQGAAFGVIFFIIVLVISAVVNKAMGKWSEATS